MENQESGQRFLDPIERAKLGLKVLTLSCDEAEEVIDDYVYGKDYDQASVDYFKDQVATQQHIKEKGTELLITGAQILRLITTAFIHNLPKQPTGR